MGVEAGDVRCMVCKTVIVGETPWTPAEEKEPCPQCGSDKRLYALSMSTTSRALTMMLASARHGQPGQIKPFYELKQGYEVFKKTGTASWVLQIVDREKGRYRKFVQDVATGKVIKDQTEPLSKHVPDWLKRKRGTK